MPEHGSAFNSGVIVLEPSASLFETMQAALPVLPSYDGGDQGFLNAFFDQWYFYEMEQIKAVEDMNEIHQRYLSPASNRLPLAYNTVQACSKTTNLANQCDAIV